VCATRTRRHYFSTEATYLTYSEALSRLGPRESRKIANNTYLERRDDGDIALRLHRTDVLTYHPDGTVTLNSGGWQTVTTKRRMNQYLPNGYRVYQHRFDWYVWNYLAAKQNGNDGSRVEYFDGMTLEAF